MKISVVNQSKLSDAIVQEVLRAINFQLLTDFRQAWDTIAECELVGKQSSRVSRSELRGDAILYLRAGGAEEGALGYHDVHAPTGVPFSLVFTEERGEDWRLTLSHEVLETVLDPHCNRLVMGPHPDDSHPVFFWLESCDAVQADSYEVWGVPVSDFVLPHYFTVDTEKGERVSFLGANIGSFGIATGGYVGFFDPKTGQHETVAGDLEGRMAAERAKYKRAGRYMRQGRAA